MWGGREKGKRREGDNYQKQIIKLQMRVWVLCKSKKKPNVENQKVDMAKIARLNHTYKLILRNFPIFMF